MHFQLNSNKVGSDMREEGEIWWKDPRDLSCSKGTFNSTWVVWWWFWFLALTLWRTQPLCLSSCGIQRTVAHRTSELIPSPHMCSGMTPRYVALRLEKQKMSELSIDTSQAQCGDKSHATPQTIVEGALTMVPLYRGLSGKYHTREMMRVKRTS